MSYGLRLSATPAPPIDDDAVSPFVTPGTRLRWKTGAEWAACLQVLLLRRISSAVYRALRAHVDELARHPAFIQAQPVEDLLQVRHAVTKHYRPGEGHRAGSSYERIINEVNNALARNTHG